MDTIVRQTLPKRTRLFQPEFLLFLSNQIFFKANTIKESKVGERDARKRDPCVWSMRASQDRSEFTTD